MTAHSTLFTASGMLRDYAVTLYDELAAAKQRAADSARSWTAVRDDLQQVERIKQRISYVHTIADSIEVLDPRSVNALPHALQAARALAADLVHQLGQLEQTPESRRRACALTPRQARTLDVVAERVVAYLRVSTDRQADEGFGLEVQEEAVRIWARQHKARIAYIVRDEGRSGAAEVIDRPGLAEALGHVQASRSNRGTTTALARPA